MKAVLLMAGSISFVFGLIWIQLRSMQKCHPNAELLIGLFRLISFPSDKKAWKSEAADCYTPIENKNQ